MSRCSGADDREELAEPGLSRCCPCPDVIIDGDDRRHARCAPFMTFGFQSKVRLVNGHLLLQKLVEAAPDDTDIHWREAFRRLLCSLIACQATVATHIHAEITKSRFVHPTSAITPAGRFSGGVGGSPPGV